MSHISDISSTNSAARLITIFTFTDGLAQGIYGTIFNLMLRTSGMPTSYVGRITSFFLWGCALLGLVFGIIADKVNKKQLMFTTHLLSVFFGTYRVLSKSYVQLGISSFLFGGFSTATGIVLSTLLILKTSKDNRTKVLGLNFGVGMLTGVLGNILGGVLGDVFPLKAVLISASISRLLALIPVKRLSIEKFSDTRLYKSDTDTNVLEFFSTLKKLNEQAKKVVLYYFLSTMSVGFGAGLFVTFGNVIFYDLFHLSPSLIGTILAMAQLATSIGAIFSYKLGRKFGDMNVLIFSYVFVPILIVLLSFVREPITFTSVYILRFAVMNMVGPLLTALVFSNIPASYLSSINGMNTFLSNVARALSADLFAALTRFKNGYTWIFVVSSIFYFANAYVMIRMYKHLKD
ncbi:Predicted arabinose efflux permease, MFS family [Fervidobacterium changbaicum]|uniref:MFS transporter n=1 Tax=Fervidobacterium changbaicum TaxID=310769 RepID=A0ABX5QTK6_9BACT|nr:MFS transporter [Fervidobacterium changbaicum]QAV33877.1 MFS transporter [Fervidobacterium changbaicum]SDH83597.1 Predicted arabinose efflux permease, MFS family [Fervidobacterium changbaicum]